MTDNHSYVSYGEMIERCHHRKERWEKFMTNGRNIAWVALITTATVLGMRGAEKWYHKDFQGSQEKATGIVPKADTDSVTHYDHVLQLK